AYGRAKAKYNFVSSCIGLVKSVAVYHYDVYPMFWRLTGSFLASYFPTRFQGEITHSLVFFFAFNLIDTIISLPLAYYHSFVLEEKFGFNKMTINLWLTDLVKSQALGLALGGPIGAAMLYIIRKTGDSFFYYLWIFMLAVQLIAVTIYPIVIVPLFNKLEPLKEGALKTDIDTLAASLSFPLAELQIIDGSKRSAHSNAYFTGLPWKKKIVIYDTLLEQSSNDEVVAVLAHELGHWKMGHTTSLLLVSQFHMFYIFALFSAFIHNASLYRAFGFGGLPGESLINSKRVPGMPIMIGLLLFNDVFAPLDNFIKLGMNTLTRRFEYQADAFAVAQKKKDALARALIKLQVSNLSSMDADWVYSAYHYSHPILSERLGAMGWKSTEKVEVKEKKKEGDGEKEDGGAAVASGREL
ncbi:hypothetical protein LTS18_002377, partial [Coniosporium uncinatum]